MERKESRNKYQMNTAPIHQPVLQQPELSLPGRLLGNVLRAGDGRARRGHDNALGQRVGGYLVLHVACGDGGH